MTDSGFTFTSNGCLQLGHVTSTDEPISALNSFCPQFGQVINFFTNTSFSHAHEHASSSASFGGQELRRKSKFVRMPYIERLSTGLIPKQTNTVILYCLLSLLELLPQRLESRNNPRQYLRRLYSRGVGLSFCSSCRGKAV